jgi:hypothetical protein
MFPHGNDMVDAGSGHGVWIITHILINKIRFEEYKCGSN